MKHYYLLIPALFFFSCKTAKVEQASQQKASQQETCYVQVSLKRGVTSEQISSDYSTHGIKEIRPISRSRPDYRMSMDCNPDNMQKVISLLEADKRVASVKQTMEKKLENTQSTNLPSKNQD